MTDPYGNPIRKTWAAVLALATIALIALGLLSMCGVGS